MSLKMISTNMTRMSDYSAVLDILKYDLVDIRASNKTVSGGVMLLLCKVRTTYRT